MARPRQHADTSSLTATVPRQFVHRASVAETLLTGWKRTGNDRFSIQAQWPRGHGLHVSPDWSAYDPLLVVETIRQAGTLIAHTEYGVPLDHQFVLQEFQVVTVEGRLSVGPLPAESDVDLVFADVQYRGRRLGGARYTARVLRDGDLVATADVAFTCVSPPVYRRLRDGRTAESVAVVPLPPGLAPAVVERALPSDVVLAPDDRPDRWQLRVDTAHPVFFDHPLDHVPGMLLLEAARQAAWLRRTGERPPAAYYAVFLRYAELDEPIWIEAKAVHGTDVQVLGTQGESAVFQCLVSTAAR
ncbi:ScbA/BarX family gamma-butyrolactone biosynthesis protein [Streptomyces sp. NBC_01275]|uniref:ScbA/BarX family gamma-butyrolactone biosynthesis protein n=1 Tax=Streptomyces sp. NBC_01275 TaxID=2903807 RepID=UPI0022523164|nr:ScbA/BarX family gamma-butyrolactone biosynthesis protein [Streptomyces sp. NBC_01275]MCX4765703.1 ScbA/BarX family gamma-butyrolactone biosynthesis protein [Streptomyces sp. NBC_01275]